MASISAAVAIGMVVNGVSINAAYLQAEKPPCELTQERARAWRSEKLVAIEQKVGKWCVVGAMRGQSWVSEQWAERTPGKSEGWRVTIPLSQPSINGDRALALGLDVFDQATKTRVLVNRFSSRSQDTSPKLQRSQSGDVLLTAPHPDGGSFTVTVSRP